MRVWAFYPAGVWTSVALWLFACVSNGGYAKMNALFTAKNSIHNVVAHILLKGVLGRGLLDSKLAGSMLKLKIFRR